MAQQKGQTLGVLIDRKNSRWHLGKRTAFLYREMAAWGAKQGIQVFFFFAKDVNWEKKTVPGWSCSRKGWEQKNFPLPAVIYDRIVERAWERRPANRELLARIQEEKGRVLFNPQFLDKAQTAQILDSCPELRNFLPHTGMGSTENLEALLNAFSGVFIKPVQGCKGQGIVVVRNDGSGGYVLKPAAEKKWQPAASLRKVEARLAEWQVPLSDCIVQEEVPRLQIAGCPLDVRALAQKDGTGTWRFVGAAGRLAKAGREVTHTVHGGRRLPLRKFFREQSFFPAEKMRQNMTWLCQTVPAVLEKDLAGTWGILALDLAVLPDGGLRILEVNARPGSFSETGIRQKSLDCLMEFVHFLAEGGNYHEAAVHCAEE